MGWEIFTRTMVQTSEPTVTLQRTGRLALNKSASRRLEEKAVERILLLWNRDTRQVGIKPISKKDTRTYKLTYGGRGNSAACSAVQFYKYIRYNWGEKSHNYPLAWNDDEAMYVFTIPADRLTGSPDSRRTVLKAKTPNKHVKAAVVSKQREANASVQ
jgi:hypothetical protein